MRIYGTHGPLIDESEDDPSNWPSADDDPSDAAARRRIEAATVHSTSSLRARIRVLAERWEREGKTAQAAELRAAMGSVL